MNRESYSRFSASLISKSDSLLGPYRYPYSGMYAEGMREAFCFLWKLMAGRPDILSAPGARPCRATSPHTPPKNLRTLSSSPHHTSIQSNPFPIPLLPIPLPKTNAPFRPQPSNTPHPPRCILDTSLCAYHRHDLTDSNTPTCSLHRHPPHRPQETPTLPRFYLCKHFSI